MRILNNNAIGMVRSISWGCKSTASVKKSMNDMPTPRNFLLILNRLFIINIELIKARPRRKVKNNSLKMYLKIIDIFMFLRV
jgi:hypothetical protein